MAFISYIQNLEDVMLWRALREYSPGIGAQDPIIDSVTKAFYDRGWSGINIEPMETIYEKINLNRPLGFNLELAIDAENGERIFYDIGQSNGLSTLVKADAGKHATASFKIKEFIVKTVKFSDICTKFIKKEQAIHFLKIDIEGNEKIILANADFKNYRPWIILIKATEPLAITPSFFDWEPTLLSADYTFVYFDGLNRFYIANEKLKILGHHFSSPPNIFDNYIVYKVGQEFIEAKTQLLETKAQLMAGQSQLTSLLTCSSWPWTKFVRKISFHARTVKNRVMKKHRNLPILKLRCIEHINLKKMHTLPNRHGWQGEPGLCKKLIPPKYAFKIRNKHRKIFNTMGYSLKPYVLSRQKAHKI